MKNFFRVLSVVFLSLSIAAVFASPAHSTQENPASTPDQAVEMVCLNVGKADCILISTEGKNYLIDTGYEQTSGLLMTALEQLGISRLNGVFITHNHKDHVGGLNRLTSSKVEIDAFYASAYCLDGTGAEHPAVAAAAKRGQSVTFLSAGDSVFVTDDVSFSVIGPLSLDTDNENNNSLVMALFTPQGNILLTGDMKTEEEYSILKSSGFPECAVLKVPFHGDDSATSEALLKAVKPRLGIISTSTLEEKDTPALDTLRRLAYAGCEVHVTQDIRDAIYVSLKNGKPSASEITWNLPDKTNALTISIDLAKDMLLVQNTSSDPVSLDGMALFSTRGEDLFLLPSGYTVEPGQILSIVSSSVSSSGDITLQSNKRIWHKSKFDEALLYDAYGRMIACTDNGKPE